MTLEKFGVNVKEKKIQEINDFKLNIDFKDIQENFKSDDVERYLPWFLKYQIKKFEDLPKTKQIKKIIDFIESFCKKSTERENSSSVCKFKPQKALLLGGPPGCGKTTTVLLLAEHFGLELFELNASDSRNKKTIDEALSDVIKQQSLFGKQKLILIDEVDGVAGREDRGGVAELVRHIKASKCPIIGTANDLTSDKVKALKKASIVIDFEEHSKELLFTIGQNILKKEKINFKEKEIQLFVEKRNTSDIRGFINDLQASVIDSKFIFDENFEIRDYKQKINNILDTIYYSYPQDALKNNFNTDVSLDDLFLYLEENTAKVYDKNSLILAFNELGKADVFKGRIMRWQYWRYLVYINFYLTYATSSIKNNVNKIAKYDRNTRILKKWIYSNKMNLFRERTNIEKSKGEELKIIERLAKVFATSNKKCRSSDLYYFAKIYQNNNEFQDAMDKKFKLSIEIREKLLLL